MCRILTTNSVSSVIIAEDDNDNNNTNKNLVGIITSTDFVNFFSENCIGFTTVKDYMSQSLFTISIKEKVFTAAQIISEKKFLALLLLTQIIKISSRHNIRN
jgi:CBS domain-containing protein